MRMCWRRWSMRRVPSRTLRHCFPQLAGAVLDVFPQEPLPADDPLWRHPQVVITPHMASAASAEVIARQLLENIQRQRRGLPLKNLVNKHAGY